MGHIAGHLAQGLEMLLLDGGLLGAAQFEDGLVGFLRCPHPIVKVLAGFLGGDDFELQGFLLQPDGLDFRAHFPRIAPHLLEEEDDHAAGDEELQHRGNTETGAVKASEFAGKGIAPDVNDPEQKAQRQHAHADEGLLLAQSQQTNPGERAAQAQQNEDRQMDLQRGCHNLRTDQNPDHQEEREAGEQSPLNREAEKTHAAPQKENRRNRHARLIDREKRVPRRRVSHAED